MPLEGAAKREDELAALRFAAHRPIGLIGGGIARPEQWGTNEGQDYGQPLPTVDDQPM